MERHEEVLVALRRIIRAIDLHSKKLMQTTGLSGPQLLVLKAVLRHGHAPVGAVAREISVSPGTVTALVDRLEAKGLVLRSRSDEDRRKVKIALTPQGMRTVSDAPTLLQEHFIQSFRGLKGWEQTLIVSAFERVAEMMDAQDLDASPVLATQRIDQQ